MSPCSLLARRNRHIVKFPHKGFFASRSISEQTAAKPKIDTGISDKCEAKWSSMRTKYVIMPLLAVILLATCVSGCTSTIPSSGQGSNTSGVPVYQPSVQTASVNSSEGKVTTYQTGSSTTQVADFYKTEMTNRGYTASTSYQKGSDVVLSFAKGTSTVYVAIASIQAQIGPLNLSQVGGTTFVVTERGT